MLEIPMQETDAVSSQADVPEVMFFMKMAHRKFKEIMNSYYLKDLTVHEIVKADGSFNGISEICKEHGITMITMGSHGASGLKEMFVGSNAEKAVRNSDVPVLVIKNNHEDFSVDDIVFCFRF